MSAQNETFFTVVGCMDGRVQEPLIAYGKEHFNTFYPDTITGPGIVGSIANNPSEAFLEDIKTKIAISVDKHHSHGIIVDGHQECAGNPVDDELHKDHVRKTVHIIQEMIQSRVPVVGVFVKRDTTQPLSWVVESV